MALTPSPIATRLCEVLEEKFKGHHVFGVRPGRRFDRIVTQSITHYDPQRDRYAPQIMNFLYIERETGGVFKSEGKRPAAIQRYTIDDEDSYRMIADFADSRKDGTFASTSFLYL